MPEQGFDPADTLARLAVSFANAVRERGLAVPMSAVAAYREALGAVAGSGPSAIYWAGRSCFVHGPDDVGAYDGAYATFFLDQIQFQAPFPVIQVRRGEADDEDDAPGPEGSPGDEDGLRWSGTETLRERDFATLTSTELAEAHRSMEDLRVAIAPRRTHRFAPTRGSGERPDLRRTIRYMLRSGGEPVERRWRTRRIRPRRLVVVCDVSGSMEPYARELMRFAHAAVAGRQEVEAFALGTRLTRLTRHLGARDPDAALVAVAQQVPDWSGGTRLGEGIREFNSRYGVRGMARDATVLICSDGVDRGDPDLLGHEMERLSRVAHRVVWVNPLKASPGYEPIARGMAAALPYVDEFVPGHSLAALVDVARSVAS